MPTRNLMTILIAVLVSLACYRQASHNRYATTVAEAMEQVREHYVQPVDQRELFENAMQGMVQQLDPYSSFIPPHSYKKWKEELDQQFGGIGILIRPDPDSQRPMVMSPILDSPAYRAGIRAGDLLMAVNGVDTGTISHEETVAIVQGKPGTTVHIAIRPYGTDQIVEHELQRALVPIESVLGDRRHTDGTWDFVLEEFPDIGYVRVTSFGEHTSAELKQALLQIKDRVRGLILDLRGNEGGLLTAAVEACDWFLADGEIVTEQGRDGRIVRRYRAHPGNDVLAGEMPMVVLIDGYSASASEIVAACLQDHGRAVVGGQRSWGKGTVQRLIELEGGRSALRLTTATFWRPSGKNIHRDPNDKNQEDWGVQPEPELRVELNRDEYIAALEARRDRDGAPLRSVDQSESDSKASIGRDPQLQRAIDYLMALILGAKEAVEKEESSAPVQ